jgi:sugar transferase (PEP-CTERM/EpsH1 system associated)
VSRLAEILFLAHRIPYPPTKGDKIRAWHFLTHLARTHVVHLACFVDDPDDWQSVDHLRTVCAECHFAALSRARAWRAGLGALARNEAASVAGARDAALAAWIGSLAQRRPIRSVFAYSAAMARYLARGPAHGLRRIVDFVDVDSEKWEQMAAYHRWPLSRLYRRESRRLRAYDRDAVERCDHCLFVSPTEAQRFQQLIPAATGKAVVVPNGVDSGHFSPEHRLPRPFEPGGPVVAFTGDMSYWPNEDGVLWFARQVLPRLRAEHPDLRFVVVGRRPRRRLRRGAARLGFTLTGAVPDVRPFLAHAAVAVAPLRVARGVPNKVLEAMAMAKAVVATPAAAAGLRVRAGEDILLAADPDAFARAVVRALDPQSARVLGTRARARALADYAWAPSLQLLDRLVAPAPLGRRGWRESSSRAPPRSLPGQP